MPLYQWGSIPMPFQLSQASYSDLLFEESILQQLLEFSGDIGIPVDLDWEDLNETVLKMLDKSDKLQFIVENSRKVYDELYSVHSFCKYWYDFFSSLSDIENE